MHQRNRLPMAALALVAAVPAGTGFLAPLAPETTAALAEMGEAVGLPLAEWGWEKKWAEADGVLPLAIRALDDPLGALEEVRGLGAGTLADDLALLGLAPDRAAAPSGETGFGRWRDWALARAEAAAAWRAELGDAATIYEEAAAALLGGSDKGEATLAALAD
ncbi:hypothetical protein IIA16_05585, partial [bacterium]|nr:hypothetical protein [bacterium]